MCTNIVLITLFNNNNNAEMRKEILYFHVIQIILIYDDI